MLALHIGLPRVGSSAIQYCLAEQAQALSRRGVHYAMSPAHSTWQPNGVSSGNGLELARYLDPRRRPPGFEEAAFEQGFWATYGSPDHPISVVSSEFLSAAAKPMLARFRDKIARRPVRVIAFVRDLYGHAFSTWAQMVKDQAYAKDFRAFADEVYDNPQCRAVRAFRRAFGRESLRVIHYESLEGGIFAAFLGSLDVRLPGSDESPRINRGLSGGELDLQLAFNRLHHNRRLSRSIADRFVARRPEAAAGRIWRPDVAELLEDRFADEVRQLNRAFFPGGPGLAIAGDTAGAPPPPAEPRSWILADAAHAVLTHAASRLMVRAGRDRDAASA